MLLITDLVDDWKDLDAQERREVMRDTYLGGGIFLAGIVVIVLFWFLTYLAVFGYIDKIWEVFMENLIRICNSDFFNGLALLILILAALCVPADRIDQQIIIAMGKKAASEIASSPANSLHPITFIESTGDVGEGRLTAEAAPTDPKDTIPTNH